MSVSPELWNYAGGVGPTIQLSYERKFWHGPLPERRPHQYAFNPDDPASLEYHFLVDWALKFTPDACAANIISRVLPQPVWTAGGLI